MSQINKGDKNSQRIVIRPEKHNQSDDDYVVINPDWLPSVPYSKKPLSNQQPNKVVSKKEIPVISPPKKEVPVPKKEVPVPKKELRIPILPKKEVPVPKKESLIVPVPKKELRIPIVPKKEVQVPKKESLIVPVPKKELRILILPKKEAPVPKQKVPVPKKELRILILPKKEAPVPKQKVPVPKQEIPVPKKEVPVPKQEIPVPKQEIPVPKKEVPVPKKEIQLIKLPKVQRPIIVEEAVIPQQRIELHPGRLPKRDKPVAVSNETYVEEVRDRPMLSQLVKLLRPITLPKRQELSIQEIEVVPKEEEIPIPIPIPIVPRPRIEIHPLMVRKRNTPIEENPPIVKKQNTNHPLIGDVIAKLNYNIPVSNDLAVLLVFFDYIGSVRILMNYLFMREKLKLANIPVFTLELVMEGADPKISDAVHVYGSSYLFQKEHLLRLLEKQIPQQFTKLACLDADVIFNDPDWYDQLSTMLDTFQVVQCFKTACWLDLTYTRMQKKAHSCVRVPNGKRFYEDPNRNYHPGYGWAFTREWYNKSGFYDLAVIGSGDTLFSHAMMGHPPKKTYETRIYHDSYCEWLTTLGDVQRSFLPVTLYHLYHGPTAKRQYVSRYAYFEKYDKIEDCLAEKNADGIYELLYPELNSAMFEVFKTRDDDGTD